MSASEWQRAKWICANDSDALPQREHTQSTNDNFTTKGVEERGGRGEKGEGEGEKEGEGEEEER